MSAKKDEVVPMDSAKAGHAVWNIELMMVLMQLIDQVDQLISRVHTSLCAAYHECMHGFELL